MDYALIGCGRIAPNHIEAAKETGLSIKFLCDRKIEKAEALRERFRLDCPCYSSLEDALDDSIHVDFVSIATDSGSHHDVAMEAFSHNLNVLVEKPIALSLKDADEMIKTAEDRNLVLGVSLQNRMNDATVLTKKAIDEGAFGRISHMNVAVRWSRSREYYAGDDWRGKWKSDGGTLMNQCIHGFDLVRYLMPGELSSVYSVLSNRRHPYLEVEDLGTGIMTFSDGAVALAEGTANVYRKDLEETITIIGEKGTVKLGGIAAEKILLWDFEDEDVRNWQCRSEAFTSVYGEGHKRIFADFREAVAQHRRPFVNGYDGRSALEVILSFYKSHLDKKPVSLPLSTFDTCEMTGTEF